MKDRIFFDRLDVYRFLAVGFVLLSHWLGFVTKYINIGEFGVIMFFVLSGFLITNSLIASISNTITERKVILNFYIRRFLRIFPIYYLTLFVFYFLFHDKVLEAYISYFLLYGSNFLTLKLQQWPSYFSHFWSLAIEEQFYIFWPLFFVPLFRKKWGGGARVVLLLVALTIYLLFSYSKFNNVFFLMNTLYSSIAIVVGALFSWFWNFKRSLLISLEMRYFLVFGLVFFGVSYLYYRSFYFNLFFLVHSILLSVCLILFLIRNNSAITGDWFWKNKRLSYLGKISYGIYVFHNFVPFLFYKVGLDRQTFMNGSTFGYIVYYIVYPPAYAVVTFLLAHFSWKYFESPINNLKKRFL